MFLTPVIYPSGLVPNSWTWLLHLNPMTAVVQGARWAVLPDATPPDLLGLALFAVEFAVLFLGGVVIFRKIDAILADRI
jgi:lipopolysaccharide transport system permease protein